MRFIRRRAIYSAINNNNGDLTININWQGGEEAYPKRQQWTMDVATHNNGDEDTTPTPPPPTTTTTTTTNYEKISLIPYTCSTCRTTCGQYPSGIGREVEEGGEASFGFCCIQDSTGRVGHGGTNGGGGGAVSSNTRKSRMRLLYHTTYCNISVECNNREFNYSTITLQHLLGTLSYHLSQHLPKGTIPQPHRG